MIAYASRTGTKRNLAALRAAGWHLLVSAAGVLRDEGFPYALDNGAWSAHTQSRPFDVPAFEKALRLMGPRAEWVVLPDVVAGGLPSLSLSLSWLPRVRDWTESVLIAVQDGMTLADLAPHLGPRIGIFVGGSTEWKLATMHAWAALAASKGAWCHVGRVNSARRIFLCASAGASSFDGTSCTRFAVNIPALSRARDQQSMVFR